MQYDPLGGKWVSDAGFPCQGMTVSLVLILLLSACHGYTPVSTGPDIHGASVAVWDLDDLSPAIEAVPNMGEFLSAGIIQALQDQKGIDVIEREKIVEVMEELRLGSSELADQETRLRLGRLAGARYMVFGGYQAIEGILRIDLRLVDVETGKVLATSSRTLTSKAPGEWLPAARQAALELVKD